MVADLREQFNKNFNPEAYKAFLNDINTAYDCPPAFRIAETPIFIPEELKVRLLSACEHISHMVVQPWFLEQSKDVYEKLNVRIPGEGTHPKFIQADFGICLDENGDLTPQMVEIQGFPSLYFFQDLLAMTYRKHFEIPWTFRNKIGGMGSEEYLALLREVVVRDEDPENVALLEIEPKGQVTQIDLVAAAKELGIELLCLSDVIKRGKKLFYKKNGTEVPIHRIFNRVILDDLDTRPGFKPGFKFSEEIDVKWVEHPSWFFRISKNVMPWLDKSPFVPNTYHLDKLDNYPDDLQNYILKPLFSFAGKGVLLDVTKNDLDSISRKQDFILQRKVEYAPVVKTPDVPARLEVRMMMVWPEDDVRPRTINNLIRLSKDKMIGVRYNKDKSWVGASVGYFENE